MKLYFLLSLLASAGCALHAAPITEFTEPNPNWENHGLSVNHTGGLLEVTGSATNDRVCEWVFPTSKTNVDENNLVVTLRALGTHTASRFAITLLSQKDSQTGHAVAVIGREHLTNGTSFVTLSLPLAVFGSFDAKAISGIRVYGLSPSAANESIAVVIDSVGTGEQPAPTFVAQPRSTKTATGQTLTLSATVDRVGASASYQWFRNGTPIAGANSLDLLLTNVGMSEAGEYTLRVSYAGRTATSSAATIVVDPLPIIVQQPRSIMAAPGGTVSFGVTLRDAGDYTFQWRLNGVDIQGATASGLVLTNLAPAHVGAYSVVVRNSSGIATSSYAILGLASSLKSLGTALEFDDDIRHSNGNVYDQMIMTGSAATMTADPGQVLRISFVDLSDDIVQLEFSGPGSITVSLKNPSGPAVPALYNQDIPYMKGHAQVTIAGATENTHFGSYSVGKLRNSNPALYKQDVTYDGVVDLSVLNILSADGRFGGIRAGNVGFLDASGITGINAPGVRIAGPLNLHDINASDSAVPLLLTGEIDGEGVKFAGGDLRQFNDRGIETELVRRIVLVEGTDSHGRTQPVQPNRGKFLRQGRDVTSEIVVSP